MTGEPQIPRSGRGHRVAVLLGVAVALTAALPAAVAAPPPQPLPRAILHVGGDEQRGRLRETSFTYPASNGLCVTQGVLGDGKFPKPRQVAVGERRLRFALNSERRPHSESLRYWTEVDSDGFPEGESTEVPIEMKRKQGDGDWILVARLDVLGKRYLQFSAFWKGNGRCDADEFLVSHYALKEGLPVHAP